MNVKSDKSHPATGELREVRFTLKKMLVEVAEERHLGSFGTEKMRQADVRRVFKSNRRPDRG